MPTAEILDHPLAAFGAADVDQVMIDSADEAGMIPCSGRRRTMSAADEAWPEWSSPLISVLGGPRP